MRTKSFDDVRETVGKPAEPGYEQPLHRTDVDLEIHPGDNRMRVGIGERRSVAKKLG